MAERPPRGRRPGSSHRTGDGRITDQCGIPPAIAEDPETVHCDEPANPSAQGEDQERVRGVSKRELRWTLMENPAISTSSRKPETASVKAGTCSMPFLQPFQPQSQPLYQPQPKRAQQLLQTSLLSHHSWPLQSILQDHGTDSVKAAKRSMPYASRPAETRNPAIPFTPTAWLLPIPDQNSQGLWVS